MSGEPARGTSAAAGVQEAPDSPQASLSLDSSCDNPTPWEKAVIEPDEQDSSPTPDDPDPDDPDDDPDSEWSRQQKRVFHRVSTLLHYWESHGYEIAWVTLTSCPDSDPADKLAYNLQRLRQTIERGRLAADSDGNLHRISHLDQLEQLCIRTSEGPPGKGVLHLFWAWDRTRLRDGNHNKRLFIPQDWLATQWGRIHGPYDEHSEQSVKPLWVWIEEYGTADYHDRAHVARYAATQYLGEHAEALEHVSWSHGRTLGGSITDTWTAVKSFTRSTEAAIETWDRIIAGHEVELIADSEYIKHSVVVKPPPSLGVDRDAGHGPEVTPPADHQPGGPHIKEFTTVSPALPELDGTDSRECPDCGSRFGIHNLPDDHPLCSDERASWFCAACKQTFANPGEGGRRATVQEHDFDLADLDLPEPEPIPTDRQTKLSEFGFPPLSELEPDDPSEAVSQLVVDSRETADDEWPPDGLEGGPDVAPSAPADDRRSTEDRIREYIERHPEAPPAEVCGSFRLDPGEWLSDVRRYAVDGMFPADD